MSMIKCPECGYDISNKAQFCPHCGYPLTDMAAPQDELSILIQEVNGLIEEKVEEPCQQDLYAILFQGFSSRTEFNRNRIKISMNVQYLAGRSYPEANSVAANKKCQLLDGVTWDTAKLLQNTFKKYGCLTKIVASDTTKISIAEKRILEYINKESVIKCPRCGSEHITTTSRGVTFLTGFYGSDKTVNRCGKCGYVWRP